MQNIKSSSKILMILLAFGLMLWLGGSIIRTVIAYDIYVPATALELKNYYTDEIRMHTVRLYGMGALYTDIAFGAAFICALFLAVRYRRDMRQRGWLFMAFVLFFLASPVEFFSIYLDIKLNFALLYNNHLNFFSNEVQKFFTNRLTKMNFVSPLAYLSVVTGVIMVIWRPLDKKKELNQIPVGQE